MAKLKVNESAFNPSVKKDNKGVHSKTKQSKNKASKNYTKPYRGQGR
jgi:hypothetical protein